MRFLLHLMTDLKNIQSALISVYYKDGLDEIVRELHKHQVIIYSTGGTLAFIQDLGIPVVAVEELTGFPEILGGRVKTLHPTVFGGILNRRALQEDQDAIAKHGIPSIDLVIVDLYPFEETVASGASAEDIIEKIDIGGISLIRAAAKNFQDVVIIPSVSHYASFLEVLCSQNGATSLTQRQHFASEAFHVSSHYDTMIHQYFVKNDGPYLKLSVEKSETLRYGENPHQKGQFFGDLAALFDKLHGKELSYNNLLDVDAAVRLIQDFDPNTPLFAIIKHNNACGIATGVSALDAYKRALEADPISAFGGVLISNQPIDLEAATLLHELFFEILIAPDFEPEALNILIQKKNRILLQQKPFNSPIKSTRSVLNGSLVQDFDLKTVTADELNVKTNIAPSNQELADLLFANTIVKHTKSNAIALVKNKQLLASGTGQTSRVDALNQAIQKAKTFGFDLDGAVMASDAFFPFPDCVEIAHSVGINAVIQPGGSVKDQLSIDYCNSQGMAMVFSGFRHFKH